MTKPSSLSTTDTAEISGANQANRLSIRSALNTSLHKTIERLKGITPPSREETTKITMILPILEALSWDCQDPDQVSWEYAVGDQGSRGKGGRVDIALFQKRAGRDQCVCFVEAKAADSNLESHVEQLLGYAFYEGTDIAVLTTGLVWWFYLPREDGPPSDRRFAILDLLKDPTSSLVTHFETYLGRKALGSKNAERAARKALKELHNDEALNIQLPKLWNKMIPSADPELVALLAARAERELRLRPSDTQVAEVLLGQRTPKDKAPVINRPITTPIGLEVSISDSKDCTKVKRCTPTGFTLWNQRTEITDWTQLLAGVAQELLYRDPSTFSNAVAQLGGKQFRFASRASSEVQRATPVGTSGWYVNTHTGSVGMCAKAYKLLRTCGYENSDLTIYFVRNK